MWNWPVIWKTMEVAVVIGRRWLMRTLICCADCYIAVVVKWSWSSLRVRGPLMTVTTIGRPSVFSSSLRKTRPTRLQPTTMPICRRNVDEGNNMHSRQIYLLIIFESEHCSAGRASCLSLLANTRCLKKIRPVLFLHSWSTFAKLIVEKVVFLWGTVCFLIFCTTVYITETGTGIRGLMRGMTTLLQGKQELLVVRDNVGRPPGELGVTKSLV